MPALNLPVVAYDGLGTCLILRGNQYIRQRGGVLELRRDADIDKAAILPLYPVKRWAELMLRASKNDVTVAPQSVVKILTGLVTDPLHEYTLDHFSKESIMATAKKAAEADAAAPAAKKTAAKPDAKAANAANAAKAAAAAPAAKPGKAKADVAAKGGTKAAAPAAPAKNAAKAPKAEAAEGRKGRPSPHNLDAVIKKGSKDFKEHVREGTHRFFRYEFLAKSVGKKVSDVLGEETGDGVPIVSKHITGAIEAGYITLSK